MCEDLSGSRTKGLGGGVVLSQGARQHSLVARRRKSSRAQCYVQLLTGYWRRGLVGRDASIGATTMLNAHLYRQIATNPHQVRQGLEDAERA